MDECKPLPRMREVMRAENMRVCTNSLLRIVTSCQGLTLVHFSARRTHILWDALGAGFSATLSDRGTWRGVTKMA